jgi:hypothetical protein
VIRERDVEAARAERDRRRKAGRASADHKYIGRTRNF